ncbi:MAG: hypothetical protein ABI867_13295 [Kofleriaceae bacterium]
MTDDLASRSKQLAKDILDELDRPIDPDRVAFEAEKDREDREALERFYVSTGQKQGLVAAWDYSESGAEVAFGLYSVGTVGAKLLEYTKVPAAKRDATTEGLRRRGIRIGGMYGGHPLVWSIDKHGLGLWSGTAALPDPLKAGGVTAVHAVVSDDHVRRAVEVEIGGKRVVVAEEHDDVAKLDPTYSHDDLLMSDARWVSYLGRDLAASLGVPFVDKTFGAA